VALSAFQSLCAGVAGGRFERLGDRDDLGRLLVVITEREVLDQVERERRQKRGGGRPVGAIDRPDADGKDGGIACPRPTPEFAAMLADEYRRLMAQLRDDLLRRVAQLKMEGHTNEEVAERLGRNLRSVARKLELTRRTWAAEGGKNRERRDDPGP
jgi:DNA-directed RNA polymerase specialized sigma24 family protein